MIGPLVLVRREALSYQYHLSSDVSPSQLGDVHGIRLIGQIISKYGSRHAFQRRGGASCQPSSNPTPKLQASVSQVAHDSERQVKVDLQN